MQTSFKPGSATIYIIHGAIVFCLTSNCHNMNAAADKVVFAREQCLQMKSDLVSSGTLLEQNRNITALHLSQKRTHIEPCFVEIPVRREWEQQHYALTFPNDLFQAFLASNIDSIIASFFPSSTQFSSCLAGNKCCARTACGL